VDIKVEGKNHSFQSRQHRRKKKILWYNQRFFNHSRIRRITLTIR